jgi:serine/threonine protein kinase
MPAHPLAHPSDFILQAFGAGKLDDAGAEAVVAHLEACAECRARASGIPGDSFLNRLRAAQSSSAGKTNPLGSADTAQSRPAPAPAPAPQAQPGVPAELRDHPQYEVVRELGRGGMGVVYLARNRLLDRPEVLKVINQRLLDHPEAGERFLREVRSAARLSHRNIVTAFAALPVGDLLVFAMEYVEGEDLAKVVKARGPLPVANACYYAQQAAQGLQHAFEKGMVHRDIKPQNLILARDGKKHVVKVLDFGLAKATREHEGQGRDLTGSGRMLGTPDYMAPEQTLDAARTDIRADIYSLGCTLYFLLSGRPPFEADSLFQLMYAHQSLDATPLHEVRGDVPAELAAVVERMLAKDPARRYQQPVEVAQALAPFCKPGGKPAAVLPHPVQAPGVTSASKGTMIPSDASVTRAHQTEAVPQPPAQAAPAVAIPVAELDTSEPPAQTAVPPPAGRGGRKRPRWPLLLAGAGAAAVVLLGILLVIKFTRRNGASTEIRLETNEVARADDFLQKGSVWRGVGKYNVRELPSQPSGQFHCTLRITDRTGDRFKGRYEFEDGSTIASTFEGTLGEPVGAIGKRKIRWQHVQDLKGDAIQRATVEVEGNIEGATLVVDFSHRDRNTGRPAGSGVIEFRAEQLAEPSIVGTWDVLFPDGSKGVAQIHKDQTLTTDFGFKATWEQTGHKVTCIETNPPPGQRAVVVDGEIDPTGQKILWTSVRGKCTYVRRSTPDDGPSVIGRWRGTFEGPLVGGKPIDFIISQDGTMIGSQAPEPFHGRWSQKGLNVLVIAEKAAPRFGAKWEGEIDPAGKTMTLKEEVSRSVGHFVRQE